MSSEINMQPESDSDIVYSPLIAVYAVICSSPVMFLFDYASIYLIKLKVSSDSPKRNLFVLIL